MPRAGVDVLEVNPGPMKNVDGTGRVFLRADGTLASVSLTPDSHRVPASEVAAGVLEAVVRRGRVFNAAHMGWRQRNASLLYALRPSLQEGAAKRKAARGWRKDPDERRAREPRVPVFVGDPPRTHDGAAS